MTDKVDGSSPTGSPRGPATFVVGIGGGGCNCIHRISGMGLRGVTTLAVNCDRLHLEMVDADLKLLVGNETVHGTGAGGRPEVGRRCMEEAAAEFARLLGRPAVVFIVTGMGGGFGTGAAPLIARLAKEAGAITLGVAFMPFSAERGRTEPARKGLEEFRRSSDAVMVIDNDRLLTLAPNLPLEEAFLKMDRLVAENISGMLETMALSTDIREKSRILETMPAEGLAMVMCETAEGAEAASVRCEAVDHPLLEPEYACDGSAHIPSRSVAELLAAGEGRMLSGMPRTNVLVGTRTGPGGSGRMLVPLAVGMKNYPAASLPESKAEAQNVPRSLRQALLHSGPWAPEGN